MVRRRLSLSPETRKDLMYNILTRLALKDNSFDELLRAQTQEALSELNLETQANQDTENLVDTPSKIQEAERAIGILQDQYKQMATKEPRDVWDKRSLIAMLTVKKIPRMFIALIFQLEYSTVCRWVDGSRKIPPTYWPRLNKLVKLKNFTKETISELRKELRLTKREIAEVIGVEGETWGDWETGVRFPNAYNWVLIIQMKTFKDLVDQKERFLTKKIKEEMIAEGEDDSPMSIFL